MAKPTAADAQLILKLYDLRREAEMRKARNWWMVTFWPKSADDFMKVATALGTARKRLVPPGGRLLGYGIVVGESRSLQRRVVSRRRIQR